MLNKTKTTSLQSQGTIFLNDVIINAQFWNNHDYTDTNRLLTGIVWHIGCSVEQFVDAVAAVAPHNREAVGLGVFLNDVAKLSVADARFHWRWTQKRNCTITVILIAYNMHTKNNYLLKKIVRNINIYEYHENVTSYQNL